jgi:hypothetical protein
MRFFASVRIPRTPFRVGLVTGPVGGHHQPCQTCGRTPVSVAGWIVYLLFCTVIGAALGTAFMLWLARS